MTRTVVADIGGTNSRFGLFETDGAVVGRPSAIEWIKTETAQNFDEVVDSLAKTDFPITLGEADRICLAIAGPMTQDDVVRPPNISWQLDRRQIEGRYSAKVFFINDFVAQALSVLTVIGRSCRRLFGPRDTERVHTLSFIGAGTGLGMATLVPISAGSVDGGPSRFEIVPSEGGNTNYPFQGKDELAFQEFLGDRLGTQDIRADDVVSGNGLQLIHEFITGDVLPAPMISKILSEKNQHPTAQWFSKFLARSCRNLSLTSLPFGGLYISGGVAARNPFLVESQSFRTEFVRHRFHSELLGQIPVYLNSDQDAGLYGAAHFALMNG